MVTFIQQFDPVVQALIATLFTWGVTAAGAALVGFTVMMVLDVALG